MLDFDLAEMYQVETRTLKQAVRRNIERFPDDFMLRLSLEESKQLIATGISQNVIPPEYNIGSSEMFAFTEQGVAMLSAILRSHVAIHVSISIMRAFVLMRQMITGYEELQKRIEELEVTTDVQFSEIYQALTELLTRKQIEEKPRNKIGFKINN
jgi:hypothetical protein